MFSHSSLCGCSMTSVCVPIGGSGSLELWPSSLHGLT